MPELSTLGRYELRRTLGKGAMGVVYEGYDPKLGRKVAIKTILQGAEVDPQTAEEYAKRFTREAKAVARLSHPNIVQVYDFGVEGDLAFLVMEFVHGTELDAYFEQGERFDISDATRLMTELLDAMAFAHEAGVIHRDIKPANIMVDDDGHAKLADFGVARVSDGQDASQAGTMVGTPAYMSPEQIQGQKVDGRTDIFSAGVVLYQFLTGQKPFQGRGVYTLARQILHEDPPAPSLMVTSVTPEYDRIVEKALAKKPEDRYQTAREFSAALNEALAVLTGKSGKARRGAKAAKGESGAAGGLHTAEISGTDVELEFWRSIKDTDETADLRLYLQKFPNGVYAELAQRKADKLRREAAKAGESEALVAKQREAEATLRAAEEKALRDAQEKARQEAELLARREAEEKARREAEARARARRAAEEKARREAEAQAAAAHDPDAAARREAEAKARREAEALFIRQQAQAYAKAQAQAQARVEVPSAPRGADARPPAAAPASALRIDPVVAKAPRPSVASYVEPVRKGSPLASALVGIVVLAVVFGAYLALQPKAAPVPAPAVPATAAPAPAAPLSAPAPAPKPAEAVAPKPEAAAPTAEAAAAKAAAEAAEQRAVAAEAAAAKSATEKAAAERRARAAEAAAKAAAESRAAAEAQAAATAAEQKAAARRSQLLNSAVERAMQDKTAAERAVQGPLRRW